MKKIKIKKKSGGYRTVYVPNAAQKVRLRLMVTELNERVKNECDSEIIHGFCPCKSPVTNAKKHIGYLYTLNMDLSSFFDTVKPEMIENLEKIKHYNQKIVFPDGRARQGLPTSPAIANLACIKMDKQLKNICKNKNIVYTRYADDLSFSGDNIEQLKALRDKLKDIIKEYGFTLNEKKTRIQSAKYGRRNITGVYVDDRGIYIPRRTKRRLRAAVHQKKINQIRGLKEWSKLKEPNKNKSPRMSEVKLTEVRHLTRKLIGKKDVWQ